jgi:flagellar hook protein FlgE
MQTALSGMNAATTMIQVSANNLANAQTPGFKSASVRLATAGPFASSAGGFGAGPLHFGAGGQVVGFSPVRQDIRVDEPLPLLALDGEGFFILEGEDGQRLFTRDGDFRLNADGKLVTLDGNRVLGFGVDADGELDRTRLRPLEIRLGSSVAAAGGGATNLRSYSVGRNGRLVGHYSDGSTRTLGQLRLARFANPLGLASRAGNKFVPTVASGLPTESDPDERGAAAVVSGAVELSNVNVGHELIELTLAGNLFRSNLAVLQTADNMLGSLFFPWRVR